MGEDAPNLCRCPAPARHPWLSGPGTICRRGPAGADGASDPAGPILSRRSAARTLRLGRHGSVYHFRTYTNMRRDVSGTGKVTPSVFVLVIQDARCQGGRVAVWPLSINRILFAAVLGVLQSQSAARSIEPDQLKSLTYINLESSSVIMGSHRLMSIWQRRWSSH